MSCHTIFCGKSAESKQIVRSDHTSSVSVLKVYRPWLGQTIWEDNVWGIWGIFGQFISTHFVTERIRDCVSVVHAYYNESGIKRKKEDSMTQFGEY